MTQMTRSTGVGQGRAQSTQLTYPLSQFHQEFEENTFFWHFHPMHSLMMNRMAVLHQNSGGIGKPLRFPSTHEISGIDFLIPPSF